MGIPGCKSASLSRPVFLKLRSKMSEIKKERGLGNKELVYFWPCSQVIWGMRDVTSFISWSTASTSWRHWKAGVLSVSTNFRSGLKIKKKNIIFHNLIIENHPFVRRILIYFVSLFPHLFFSIIEKLRTHLQIGVANPGMVGENEKNARCAALDRDLNW